MLKSMENLVNKIAIAIYEQNNDDEIYDNLVDQCSEQQLEQIPRAIFDLHYAKSVMKSAEEIALSIFMEELIFDAFVSEIGCTIDIGLGKSEENTIHFPLSLNLEFNED